MRILILTQYYPPEVGAAQNRLSCLARFLKRAGHSVTVLTAVPNYPSGNIHAQYRNRLIVEEVEEGITVLRTWLYTRPGLRFFGRLANYLSFSALALVMAVNKVGRQHVVITECPPLFTGFSGFFISKLKRAKFAFNISDLWTDSAVDLGMLKNKTLIALAHRMELFLYQRADLITCQTQGIVSGVRARVPEATIALVTNGIEGDFFRKTDDARGRRLQRSYTASGKFVVGYAGLHGLMQDLETVVDAARLLRDNDRVAFAFYGDGPQKVKLMRRVSEERLENVEFFPPQPVDRMPEIFAGFDAMVVPLRDLPVLKGAIPCKLLEAMAAGVPIVLAALGEAKHVVEAGRCGIVVLPEAPQLMADAICALHHNEPMRVSFGQNGRQHAFEHYNRDRINERFEVMLSGLCSGERGDGTAHWVKV